MTREEFIAAIDFDKLKTIDLSKYDEDNITTNRDEALCWEVRNRSCDDLNCYCCPLDTKAETIKLIQEYDAKKEEKK